MDRSIPLRDRTVAPKTGKFNPRLLIGVAAIVAAGYVGWRQFGPAPVPTAIRVSGRVEADETDIGAKTGGRVDRVLVREGDRVTAGQVIAVIVDEEVNQQIQAAIAQVSAARQEEARAKLEVSVAESRIQEARANLAQAQEDTSGRVSQAEATVSASQAGVEQARAEVTRAEAEIKRAQARLKLAKADLDRYNQLFAEGVVSRQQFDRSRSDGDAAAADLETARANVVAKRAAVNTAEKQLEAARGNLVQTRSTGLNPTIRSSQLTAYEQQKEQAIARLAMARASVQGAIANQQQLQKRWESFQVKSPIDGIVQDRPLEPGAVVTSGKTLLTVIDPRSIYLRAYVPEGDIGKIYVGKSARVFLDSAPDQPLPARVSAIDAKASFTPENIYFQKDRVRQVFGVKLAIEQPENYAKPGMPAEAEIDLKS
jgi:HlyD family secretion protein